jgi:hypothetical protein
VQVRGEFFNIFNNTNFYNPGSTIGNAGYGVITQAYSPRQAQVALKLMF